MYSATDYPAPYHRYIVTGDNSSTAIVNPLVRVRFTSSGNMPVRVEITIRTGPAESAEEAAAKPRPPWHQAHAKYEPRCRDLVPVWKAKRRIEQQRPRDGLR